MSLDDFPTRDHNSVLATRAETLFEGAIVEVDRFAVQQRDRKDYGIDFQIEAANAGGMTNFRVCVQLKGTDSNPNKDESISISVKRTNLNYLLSQPNSIYVCYHAPTDRLLVRSADDVFRDLEHQGAEWRSQDSITIRFRDPFNADYQAALQARTIAGSSTHRDERLDWVATPPEEFHSEVVKQVASIHVPESPEDAFMCSNRYITRGTTTSYRRRFRSSWPPSGKTIRV